MGKEINQKKRHIIYRFFALTVACVLLSIATTVNAADIVVDSLDDDLDGDGVCTLREAIINANDNTATVADCVAGDAAPTVDRITFDTIQGTIDVGDGATDSGLPVITDGSLLIDGLSATGAPSCGPTRALTLSINGANAGVASGLNIDGVTDVTIRGLNIHSFSENGIQISDSSTVYIQCNHIGTDAAGAVADANGKNGVLINDGSSGVIVGTNSDGVNDVTEYNVISGNDATAGGSGIIITEASTNNIIVGNRIGTDVTGLLAVGNGGIGIQVQQASTGNRIGTNSDGISDVEERNIISGNGNHGVSIFDLGTDNNIVAGNYIGLGIDGITDLGNAKSGINITEGADGNLVGGPGSAAPNYISGNGNSGVWVQTSYADFTSGTRTSNNTVQRNIIGLNTADAAEENGNQGLLIDLTVNTVVISNTISENGLRGIYVRGAETTISENNIVNNGRSGIEIIFDEGADTFNPESEASTADDIVSSVDIFDNVINGNCKSSNPCGGIYGNDDSVDPDNRDKGVTVAAANTIGTNNGRPDVIQYWYGAVEFSDNGVIQTSSASVISSNGGDTYTLADTVTAGADLNSTILHGPDASFVSTDVRTWEFIQEFEVDESGTSTDFAPHVASFIPFSFDADATTDPSDTGTGFIGEGIASPLHSAYTTANSAFTLTRYQIMEVATPYVTLAATPSVVEGNTAAVTVTVNVIQTVDVTVTVTYNDGTATNSADYTPTSVTVVIPAGSTTASIPVNTNDDTVDEPDENYTVTIDNIVNANDDSTPQSTTILDNDEPPAPGTPPQVTLDATQTINEGATAPVLVNLNSVATEDVTVVLSISDGTANSGSDYTPPAVLTVVIPAGDTSATVNVPTISDTTDEADETFLVDITSVSNATDASTLQTVTILDDDDPAPALPVVTLDATQSIGEGSNAPATVNLSAAAAQDVTVVLSIGGGTANSASDYTIPANLTVVIPAGDTSATITVPTTDDTTDEADETFLVDIASVTNATDGSTQQTVTILDNDDPPIPGAPTTELTVDTSVTEGETLQFTVTIDTVMSELVTFTIAYDDGTAIANLDYEPNQLFVSIPPNETTAVADAYIIDDDIVEDNETFQVTIDSDVEMNFVNSPATVTIIDNDNPPPAGLPTVTLSATPVVFEGNTAVITATLSVVSTEDVTVTIRYVDDTATGDDITPSTSIIVIPAGSLSAAIQVNTVVDNVDEGFEDFGVAIDSVSNANDGSTLQVVMINDPAPVDNGTRSPTSLDEIEEPTAIEHAPIDTSLLEPTIYMPLVSGGQVAAQSAATDVSEPTTAASTENNHSKPIRRMPCVTEADGCIPQGEIVPMAKE